MGVLSKAADFVGMGRKGFDDVAEAKRAAASDLNKSADDITDAELDRWLDQRRVLDDINSGFTGRQKLAGALAGIGGGSYAIGEWQKAEAAGENNERYQELQECISRADRLEATGQISSEEADERRERCYSAYRDPSGDTPQSLSEWLASLGTIELTVLSLAAAWLLVSTVPSIIDGIMASGKMKEVLG